MQDYEKLGAFYLGKVHDLAANQTRDDLLLYDSKDLTTHAVCVGMTGSGKTGLCLALLEEAAIDGIPAIAIDPKGDLGNLLLAFPNLQPADFRPWVEEGEAARSGMTADQFAVETANRWKQGLAEWGQDGARIARYRDAVDIAIYTPGSNAGLPLTVLRSFDAPPAAVLADSDALRERVLSSTSGLLALLGIDADPIRSREHILLSNLFDRAWREGRSLNLAQLIREIQQPPFDRVGIIDIETFFPAPDRFGLSMQLNNLVASPSFAGWLEGEPLDIKRLLYTPQGKPRLSIISIAHLPDSERMFFVTILLNEVLAWARGQSGTSSLRALLYMDEVFGYFPPTANPPSKTPMLTLLKQARAYGLGVVLATQNPVDLDYKGLSNAGTWFLGRLQTERDKARVLEGLEGASAATGRTFDRQAMEATLAGLGNRVFLMNNVHDDESVVFRTRWALSYLRGPLTRGQIQTLMAPRKQLANSPAPGASPYNASGPTAAPATMSGGSRAETTVNASSLGERPLLPPEAGESFLPARSAGSGGKLVYRPAILGIARVHFVRASSKTDFWKTLSLLRHIQSDEITDLWSDAEPLEAAELELMKTAEPNLSFAPIPAALLSARSYKTWVNELKDYLYREQLLKLWHVPDAGEYSLPGENEGDFRVRIGHQLKEQRDLEVERLRKQYATKLTTLRDRLQRAEEKVSRETSQYRESQLQSAITFGASILGAVFGRKLKSATNVTRAGTAIRSIGKAARERGDIGRAEDSVESLQEKLTELEDEFKAQVEKVESTLRAEAIPLEEFEVRPRKSDLAVDKVVFVWTPWHVDSNGIATPDF